ncbi:MAG: helix-turn-helix domain-containing protein [Candidatus Abyssubacteria bacterium]|nr:helix-turn-helix domain-containing protein [Candidatus Abyssubacteria bacterium]
MGKMEETLRTEITRLARKELRATVGPLERNVRQLRRSVAQLSRVVARLDGAAAKKAQSQLVEKAQLKAIDGEVETARISARVIKNLRKKLGVSQEKLAALVDVSPGAVAAWEQNRARPRGKNKTAIVALRKMGRRDVKRILAEKGMGANARRGRKKS